MDGACRARRWKPPLRSTCAAPDSSTPEVGGGVRHVVTATVAYHKVRAARAHRVRFPCAMPAGSDGRSFSGWTLTSCASGSWVPRPHSSARACRAASRPASGEASWVVVGPRVSPKALSTGSVLEACDLGAGFALRVSGGQLFTRCHIGETPWPPRSSVSRETRLK